jgi:hypothetical protein
MTRFTLICRTCRIRRYLGSGCFGTWGNVAEARTAIEFWNSLSECDKTLAKNIETLNAIATHEGHEFVCYHEEAMDWVEEDFSGYSMEPQIYWEDNPAYEGA